MADLGYIYKRGTWKSGFGSLSPINTSADTVYRIYNDASAVRINANSPVNDEHHTNHRLEVKLNNIINFTPYKTVTFVISGTMGLSWNSHGNTAEHSLWCSILDPSGSVISRTFFKTQTYEVSLAERTITIDVSTLNVSGYLTMCFLDIYEAYGLSSSRARTNSYIHEIKLT